MMMISVALAVLPERSRRIHEESRRNIQRLEEGGTKRRRYALPEEEEEMQVGGGETFYSFYSRKADSSLLIFRTTYR